MLRDVIYKNLLQIDDVCKTMGLRRDQQSITFQMLKEGIKKMDHFFNDSKASRAAKFLMNGNSSIPMKDLIQALGCSEGV